MDTIIIILFIAAAAFIIYKIVKPRTPNSPPPVSTKRGVVLRDIHETWKLTATSEGGASFLLTVGGVHTVEDVEKGVSVIVMVDSQPQITKGEGTYEEIK